jgi:acyl-CoA thioester hydrolase
MTVPLPFLYQRRVEFADTDMAGIVHFSRIFCYMEEAEHAFLRSVGLSVHAEVDGRTISWPRLSAKCDYTGPLRFEQIVSITVQIVEQRRKTVRYRFVATCDGRDIATGEFLVICCEIDDAGVMRSVEIPPELSAALARNQPPRA